VTISPALSGWDFEHLSSAINVQNGPIGGKTRQHEVATRGKFPNAVRDGGALSN
jgi:hypothetical protein